MARSAEPEAAEVSPVEVTSLADHKGKFHRIKSVPDYKSAFPDTNAVQLTAAKQWGVSPVKDRSDAEARKRELVYIASSPYYHVDNLRQSIPYLVPRAAVLLQDIGQAFYDSLYIKGVPLHRLIVTSVLRTEEDVVSVCHRKPETVTGHNFDICHTVGKVESSQMARVGCVVSMEMPQRILVISMAQPLIYAITVMKLWNRQMVLRVGKFVTIR